MLLPVLMAGTIGFVHSPPSCLHLSTQPECSLDRIEVKEIDVEVDDTAEWHGRIDIQDHSFLWTPITGDSTLNQFRNSVRERIGDSFDSRSLIDRQRQIFAAMPGEWKGEAKNSILVLDGTVGKIEPMTCLEAMIWKWQNNRFPMISYPTEFGAFILKRDTDLRIYLSSSDIVGARIRSEVLESIQTDIESGFVLLAHLHNHPFLFDRSIGDRMWTMEGTINDIAGALAPSMTDISFYKGIHDTFGLEEAWITNGIETSKFSAEEFDLLRSR